MIIQLFITLTKARRHRLLQIHRSIYWLCRLLISSWNFGAQNKKSRNFPYHRCSHKEWWIDPSPSAEWRPCTPCSRSDNGGISWWRSSLCCLVRPSATGGGGFQRRYRWTGRAPRQETTLGRTWPRYQSETCDILKKKKKKWKRSKDSKCLRMFSKNKSEGNANQNCLEHCAKALLVQ